MKFQSVRTVTFRSGCMLHLQDHLKHELFWWPETLLTYPIDFRSDPVSADALALYDCAANEQVPFQLSNAQVDGQGKLQAADLSLVSSLGSGESRSFMLVKAKPKTFGSPIRVTRGENSLWVDTGLFSAQIPSSQIYPVLIPGPVMQVEAKGIKLGTSHIDPGRLQLVEIVTDCLEHGALFASFSVKYVFDGGKTYEAVLRFVRGMDFVQMTERTEHIAEHDDVSFRLYWSGLGPTHRHAPNNPAMLQGDFTTPYEEMGWSKIDEEGVGGFNHPVGMWSNGKDGEIPFRLSLYEPQAAIVKVNAAAFWNETSGQSVGAFIVDEALWDNRQYDLFCSSDSFAIRFYYQNGLLSWKYPLVEGVRTSAIAVYDHAKDKLHFEQIRPKQAPAAEYLAGGTRIVQHGSSYCMFLQNRYSLLSLNKIKDYVLDYPEHSRRVAIASDEAPFPDAASFEDHVMNYNLIRSLPTFGQRENAGFSPVPYRRMVRYAAAYSRFREELPPENRKRIEALLLLLTYLAASEEVVPLLHMIGGPPNLQGDVRRALGYMATLFPDHPDAEYWKEMFAKFVETSLRLFTRPELKGLRLTGGRWAENIGTYTWAYLIPALKTAMLLEKHEGMRNLFATPYSALLGNWLVHAMTAPFNGENEQTMELMNGGNHYWGCFAEGYGAHRVYLPIGAHAARRTTPSSMREYARRLERYDPLLAEHIHYVCSDLADDFEHRVNKQRTRVNERDRWIRGTRPEFKSTAFTGYGIMLRGGVYTSAEVSVFVQQIDEGPNYRWGTAGAGGNGNLYYYAAGKAYSHNGLEDAGDRRLNDCEVACNFGVWKNNKFTSIGPNVITNAYHALGTWQFTSIEPEKDDKSYSFPEYKQRNVLLSGTDYISIYDATGTPAIRNRFTWSVSSFDVMPQLHLITDYEFSSKLTTGNRKGRIDSVWYEGKGDCFAIVSHREDLQVEKRDYGAFVACEDFADHLFRSGARQTGRYGDCEFDGTVGAIREWASGRREVALVKGHRLRAFGIELGSKNGKTGISLSISPSGEWSGYISSLDEDRIAVSVATEPGLSVYIGAALCVPGGDGLYAIAAGEHTLELIRAGEQPTPAKPVIRQAVFGDGLCEITVDPAAGAKRYRVEVSSDYGESWNNVMETESARFTMGGLSNDHKYFVRVAGQNEARLGTPSHEYPLYPTAAKPLYPEGLDVIVKEGQLCFSWGRVLGAASYRLYEQDGHGHTTLIYSGPDSSFCIGRDPGKGICRYAVSAVNLCGEGEKSPFDLNDDPASLRNYKPLADRLFNRNSLYNHHPFTARNTHKFREVPSSYPDSVR